MFDRIVPATLGQREYQLSEDIKCVLLSRGSVQLPWQARSSDGKEANWLLTDNFAKMYLGVKVWKVATFHPFLLQVTKLKVQDVCNAGWCPEFEVLIEQLQNE
jgi:hypothetical protein